jgi:peptidoglycan/LPS O-acetylase OafA/YrhL
VFVTQIQKAGIVLLSIWLILAHIVPVLGVNIPNLNRILMVVGMLAGGALLLGFTIMEKGRRRSRQTIALLLLGVWLILVNLLPVVSSEFNDLWLLNLLAVAAGVLLLLEPA